MTKATDRLSYNWNWMFFVELGFNGTCESRQASNQEREVQRVEMWGHAWMWRIQKVRKQSFTFSRVVFVRTIIVVTAEGPQGQEQPAAVQKKFLQQWLVAVREKEKVKTLIVSVYSDLLCSLSYTHCYNDGYSYSRRKLFQIIRSAYVQVIPETKTSHYSKLIFRLFFIWSTRCQDVWQFLI